MPLTADQKSDILTAYSTLRIPSDRLPHSAELSKIAEDLNVTPAETWKFIVACRRPATKKRLPITGGSVDRVYRLPRLSEDHTARFEKHIPHLINSAEHAVYGVEFLNFAAMYPNRTVAEWAVDLIRYRKQKNEKRRQDAIRSARKTLVAGAVSDTNEVVQTTVNIVSTGAGTPVVTEVPALVFAINNAKDNTYFVGPGQDMPTGLVVLGAFDEDGYGDVRQSIRREELSRNTYRLFRDDVLYVLDFTGEATRPAALAVLGFAK